MTKSLVERWNALQEAPLAALSGGAPSSPFGHVAGRLDLRGMPLSSETLRKISIERADLSYADLEQVRLERCRFVDVVLDRADARNLSDHGNVFERCRFDRVNLAGAGLGFDGSRYLSCFFGRVRFTRAVFARAEFTDCTFEDCTLKGVDFNASSFEGGAFRGPVEEVWFRGGYPSPADAKRFGKARPNCMRDVDLTAATLADVTFSNGCDLSTVRLPADGGVERFDRWGPRLKTAIAASRDDEIVFFLRSYVPHAQSQDTYLLSRRDLAAELGDDKANAALRLLRDA